MSWDLSLLALSWILYGVIHSILASQTTKDWVLKRYPNAFPAYRLIFNVLAVVLVIPPLALNYYFQSEPLWTWSGAFAWLSIVFTIAAIVGFIWSLRYYDMSVFSGSKQWNERHLNEKQEAVFTLSPLHRYVRHPWYFFALIIIWTRDMDPAFLTTSIIVTLYFFIGSYFEEKKLVEEFGQKYRTYQSRVPGVIPMPWRYLTKREADEITGLK